MRIWYTGPVEGDDMSDQTEERSIRLTQGHEGQRVQAEIPQEALKKAHMTDKTVQNKKPSFKHLPGIEKAKPAFLSPSFCYSSSCPDPWAIWPTCWGTREGEKNPSLCPLSPQEASSLGKWWSAAFKSKFSVFINILDWILICRPRPYVTLYNHKSYMLQ